MENSATLSKKWGVLSIIIYSVMDTGHNSVMDTGHNSSQLAVFIRSSEKDMAPPCWVSLGHGAAIHQLVVIPFGDSKSLASA